MDGAHGAMKPTGNTTLVEYGIQTEESDLRIHVSVATRSIYVYETRFGVEAILSGKHRKKPARTEGIVTAIGYIVPPIKIEGCQRIEIPLDVFADADFRKSDMESERGRKAEWVVNQMLDRGLIPTPTKIQKIVDRGSQIRGADTVASTDNKIQIKCDWRAGERELGGSGYLFLQIKECNPFKRH